MGTLRYLSEAEMEAATPTWAESIALAGRALRALARGDAQLPPKPKVFQRKHPGAFTNAMPAYSADGDLLGVKWVAVEARNEERGLPVINALMVLNNPDTGEPRSVMSARWLTGVRTAAVTGACLEALSPADRGPVAILGTGLQTRTHLPVLEALGHRRARIWGRRGGSIDAVVAWGREHAPALELEVVPTPEAACRGAAAIVTAITQGVADVVVDAAWLRPDVVLLPLDYGTCVRSDLADGRLFLSDDPDQFMAVQAAGGTIVGYRRPDAHSGAHLDGPPPAGGALVQNLGNGVADLFVADAFAQRAETLGIGTLLEL